MWSRKSWQLKDTTRFMSNEHAHVFQKEFPHSRAAQTNKIRSNKFFFIFVNSEWVTSKGASTIFKQLVRLFEWHWHPIGSFAHKNMLDHIYCALWPFIFSITIWDVILNSNFEFKSRTGPFTSVFVWLDLSDPGLRKCSSNLFGGRSQNGLSHVWHEFYNELYL